MKPIYYIRNEDGGDQENAIDAFANGLVEEPSGLEKHKEDMIDPTRQNNCMENHIKYFPLGS